MIILYNLAQLLDGTKKTRLPWILVPKKQPALEIISEQQVQGLTPELVP